VQTFHLSHGLVRHIPTQMAHMQCKALRIARILCQPVKVLYMHAVTPRATDTPAFKLQVDPPAGNREVACPHDFLVVTPPASISTVTTQSCFFRLLRWITRAYRSPNTPTNFDQAVNPGKANNERIDLGFFIA